VWRTFNIKVNRLLPALTNKLFEMFQETLWEGWMLHESCEIAARHQSRVWIGYVGDIIMRLI
jgi:hypothetical protein